MANSVDRPVQFPPERAFTFGQVLVRPLDGDSFLLSHRDDANSAEAFQTFNDPEAALEIARFDDVGEYRPLKTAPNLRHGWRLHLNGVEALGRALDLIYPGRSEVFAAHGRHQLTTTPLRATLGRQSGMYRAAANISNQQLDCLVADFCRSDFGCLRTILWKRDANGTIPSTNLQPEKFDPAYDQALASGADSIGEMNIPLLCQEACNLLVAECRNVVKGRATTSED